MRYILALLFGASISHAYTNCRSNLHEELERERREDLEAHECRACGQIYVWEDGNCPEMGYECDETLAITTRVLSANDCNCAQLRCRATHAFIAVNGQISGKLHCKNRKWWTPYHETESAVCARSCGLNVCPLQPARYFLEHPSHRPLVVAPPDTGHKCAWAECQNGAVAKPIDGSSDVTFQGLARFACSGDRSWTYTGPEAEVRNLKFVVCLSNGCQSCTKELITITTTGQGAHNFDSAVLDSSGTCAILKFTCKGPNANIEVNGDSVISDGDDGAVDGVASLSVECNSDGTGWMKGGAIVTQVECASSECRTLPFADSNAVCTSKYHCYEPNFVDGDDEGWTKMVRVDPNALRREEDNTEIAPTCKGGVWQVDRDSIDSSTKVMCITCPSVDTVPDDSVEPTVSEHNKEVTCKSGKMTIEFGDGGKTPVTSLKCSTDFVWTATGGNFGPFKSLEELVNQGVSWKARCIKPTQGGCNSCTKELITITKNGPGAHYFDGDVIETMVSCSFRTLTCKGTNANIELNKGGGVVTDGEDGAVDGVAKLVLICSDDGTTWKLANYDIPVSQVECASTGGLTCQALPFDDSNVVCGSKYKCYEPEFKNDEVPAKMDCKDPGALRMSEENTEITPTCKNGVWTDNGSEFGKTTNVMCINCPEIDKNSADEVKPDSDRNRAVTCASGQLTIEYESGGTKRVPVTSLTCSSEFAWETTGGTFPGYPSFDELNKAIKWKARCIPPKSGDCRSCSRELISITKIGPGSHDFASDNIDPSETCAVRTFTCKGDSATIELNGAASVTDTDGDGVTTVEVECNTDGTAWLSRDPNKLEITQVECSSTVGPACQALPYDAASAVCGSKYDCYEPAFKSGEVPAKMECDDPGALRRTADIEKIAPTCKNGAWTENGVDFEKTTKVMCINCPDIITNLADEDLPKSEGNRAVTCDKGQLTIEYERDGLRQVPVSSLTCSSEFAWSATGGPFPGFSSFTDLNNEIGWKARCIKPATGDCHSCTKALVSVTKNSAGSHDFESDNIDQSGTCAVLSFICKGTSANIEFNKGGGVVMDGEDGAVDGVAKLTLVCNADGTAWKPMVDDMSVTQVECASLGG